MTYWTAMPVQWTEDERAKAAYVAKRAIRNGADPAAAVASYMGMPAEIAAQCVDRAKQQLRGEARKWGRKV